MKGNAKPIYFSAYPLKAIKQSANSASNDSAQSPYLRGLLAGRTKMTSRARVFPMINPYRERDARPATTPLTPIERILSRVPK